MTNTYCETKAAPPGSTLYYSLLFSPPDIREAIIVLYAFYQEIRDTMENCNDELVALTKLQWWNTELIQTFNGKPQHPVTQALLPITQKYQIPTEILQSLIARPDTEHITKLIALYIPGGNQTELAPYVHELAQAMQLIDNIIHFRKFSQPPFPIADLPTQAQRAEEHYQQAIKNLPLALRRTQLSQIIFAELQLKLLAEIRKDGFNVLTHKITLTPLRKLWIAWRIKRKCY